jgi:hypothetical protein
MSSRWTHTKEAAKPRLRDKIKVFVALTVQEILDEQVAKRLA